MVVCIIIGWSEPLAALSEQKQVLIQPFVSKLPMAHHYDLPCDMNDI